jgi:hypothetical protein
MCLDGSLYLLVFLNVIEVEDEVRLEERMAEAAVFPVRLPVLALALAVNHAGVDAQGFALNLVTNNNNNLVTFK